MKLSPSQQKLTNKITSGFRFSLYLFLKLPMGWLAGLRVIEINEQRCITSIPSKWLNKNPFKSTYFAVQSMAAELSTATACLLAVHDCKPSVAFIIVDLKASFSKKATGKVHFTCVDCDKAFIAVQKCIETGESSQATFMTEGRMLDGTPVSTFEFTWSFKQRGS